ncbi:hypothetical protein [Streptomyces tropicalis]|uniref:Uncharacterized protein n=1 Tax=Streptomyces tropicalis TaxID=3034234 RepID=A0ABT6ABF0_9ACTN|nr:hypothetical protein [Streptomyces tropicalis]MDF3301973.1 hypothetical protein [Streptomyces tropicalis]
MGVSGGSGGQVLGLDTLVRLGRALRGPGRSGPPGALRRLVLPEGMTTPLGCDAVAVPARLGPLVLPRLPRSGCVYADAAHWWWVVPSDSDYALHWPAPVRYAPGTLHPDVSRPPVLIHRPDGTVPYTPPIPLYLTVCRVTGTAPSWTRPISA